MMEVRWSWDRIEHIENESLGRPCDRDLEGCEAKKPTSFLIFLSCPRQGFDFRFSSKKNPKNYGLGLSSRHGVSSHSLDVDVALERSTRQRQDPQKYCNTLKAGKPPFRSSLCKDHRVCLDSNMLLLLDRRGRRISACRLIGCFSPRCKHSRQHERSLGKAGASPTWLHCAACRLLSHRSALALRLTPPPSTSIAYHHSCHL